MNRFFLILVLLLGMLYAQVPFQIRGQLQTCDASQDSLFLYETDGLSYKLLTATPIEAGKFHLKGNLPAAGFYAMGTGRNNVSMVYIAGNEPEASYEGSCKFPPFAELKNSPYSEKMAWVRKKSADINLKTSKALTCRKTQCDEKADSLLEVAQNKEKNFLDSLKNADAVLGVYAELSIFQPYDDEKNMQYRTEQEYVVQTYLQGVDMKQEALSHFFQMTISTSLYMVTLRDIEAQQQLDIAKIARNLLKDIPSNTYNYRMLLSGVIIGMLTSQNMQVVEFIDDYLQKFPEDKTAYAELKQARDAIANQAEIEARLAIGKMAPDIKMKDLKGKKRELKSLRGNYVLIDFWASWCKPCRQESPYLLMAYKRYHDEGFEIFSVSMDKSAKDWKDAILMDGMEWKWHVCDPANASKEVAQLYNISSIPTNFLIDPQGKIVAKNLRGPALESKLKEIYHQK